MDAAAHGNGYCKECGHVHTNAKQSFCGNSCREKYQQKRIQSAMNPPATNQEWPYGVSFSSMLMSEEYRLKVALEHSKTNSEAASLLGISIRTIYRWFDKYKVKGHEKI